MYLYTLLQEVANAARKRAVGLLEASTFMEVEAPPEAAAALSAGDAAAQAEQQYAAELQKELAGGADADDLAADEQPGAPEQAVKVRLCIAPCRTVSGTYVHLPVIEAELLPYEYRWWILWLFLKLSCSLRGCQCVLLMTI